MKREREVERLRVENRELRQLLAASQAQVSALQAQVVQLRSELAVAAEQIAALEEQMQAGPGAPAFVKAKRKRERGERGPRKKRAAEHNRSRPRAVPTRIERHALAQCPDCGYVLRGESLDYSRQVVELPPPAQVEVIEHQVIKRWCAHCGRWRSPQLDLRGQVFGQGRIGVRIASLVAYLRTTLRLPVRPLQQYLTSLHGLVLSVGEIVELAHAVRQQLQGHAEQLLVQVRGAAGVHQDETGWREDGQNGYVWVTATAGPGAVRYYEYSPSRSHHVAQRLLGPGFRGVLVSDFYAAYNLLPGRHQRCWAHLLADLHALKDAHPARPEVLAWAQAVRQLYDEAQAWLTAQSTPTPAQRQQMYLSLHERACTLGQRYAREAPHPCGTLAKRLLRHQDELFQFVLLPGLPADNNLAERSLRPLVIMRKISGGTRSPAGSQTRLTLASLCATWQARHLNPFLECLAALQQRAPSAQAASP
jgi:transposase